jgi:hypothetical protein
MNKLAFRLVVLAILTLGARPVAARQECAEVGSGCENACQGWCGQSAVLFSGCGCPTVGSYGNSCDCVCDGDPTLYTGVPQIENGGDLPCKWDDGLEQDCTYCPTP